jgi:D-tyrosyl-tRNA(Tyr) deacylase
MRIVLQRVKKAKVKVNQETVSQIGKGLLILFGVEKGDTDAEVQYLSKKIVNLRIFPDENEKMNLSVKDIGGEILVVSQFTLASYVQKGNRPSFSHAMREEGAEKMYERFVELLKEEGILVKKGVFKAHMEVELVNDGPVTIILERKANSKQSDPGK